MNGNEAIDLFFDMLGTLIYVAFYAPRVPKAVRAAVLCFLLEMVAALVWPSATEGG